MKSVPAATYRLQFNKDFTFNSASEILGYLHKLGISDVYASPIWYARKGSMHGYDVVDPTKINPELGTEADFNRFRELIKKYRFGWLQDIVPNHMAYSGENQMLVDLLENGRNSRYFNFFDIDWNHPHKSMKDRILAPFLGKMYKESLESAEIQLKYNENGFSVNYYETRLPLRMESYSQILSFGLNNIISTLGRENQDAVKYLGVVYFLRALPSAEELDERYYQIIFVKKILWELYSQNDTIRTSINKTLEALNGKAADPQSFDLLDGILRSQHYRLCYWKVAVEEINYRRFFNISDLISLRMEEEDVFKKTHSLINQLIASNEITGLRIDHIDGLYNPTAYLKRIKEDTPNIYLVVEKILEMKEVLPGNWPTEGTTGYRYVNYLTQLFVKNSNSKLINSTYQRFTKVMHTSRQIAHQKKRLIIQARMAGEVERLAFLIEAISSKDRRGIDITMHALKGALEEILTYFPVYRTYINRTDYSEQDKRYIDYVIDIVNRQSPRFVNEVNYIGDILKMDFHSNLPEEQKELALDFIMKFQQLTGPLMAKGFEDTALYVYNRLVSLNEVGGDPSIFGLSAEDFHRFIINRQKNWPHSMNASSTHDTKRGEDTRARINVLSELPDEWEAKLKLWNRLNKKYKKMIDKVNIPDRNDEYFLYQNLIGAFPFDLQELPSFRERMKDYIVKAVREAKVHTAWIKPDELYENTFRDFIESILTPGSEFLPDFIPFQQKILFYGVYNSIAQIIIKFTSPGVPDIYQGCEGWNFSLVDPDNRRPVNYKMYSSMLDEILSDKPDCSRILEMLNHPESGKIKIFFTHQLLKARLSEKELFMDADYEPIPFEGDLRNNLFGFRRKSGQREIITITGRFFTEIIPWGSEYDNSIWKDTSVKLPEGDFKNLLTGEEIRIRGNTSLSEVLEVMPFAVLMKHSHSPGNSF